MYMYKVYVHSDRQGLNSMALKNYTVRRKTNELWNNQAVEILTLNLKTSSHFSPSWVILLFCWARYLSQIVLPFTQEYNSGKSFREIWIIICGYIQYNRDTGIQSRGSVWTLSLEYSFPVTEI